ncbi:Gmad2 immunoglobulin-like domain-containing protein [Patescibacteria group bacterium]|nr:Gmad2 immunoglobulin-like domain-containing protein [Patescibacteria group bacterium]MBU1758018.1 Gmad2 immunoglobulin-like domain-containing protein [Patescibacteria group bacterium]
MSWIDRQVSLVSGATSYQSPHTGTVTLTVTATGYGEDFTGNLTYTTDDDDKIILQAFTTGTDYTSF